MNNQNRQFSLDDLCALLEMNKRKIRYYIQHGLVDRPEGSGKGAFYTHKHLEQLLAVKKWKAAGLSLDRIKEITGAGEGADKATLPPPRTRKPGDIEVWSHIHLADGVELQIEPERSGLSPDQIRRLVRSVMQSMTDVREMEDD
jgi:DNA-binding transcriptional MerR regulator